MVKQKNILVINGPNLQLLGKREPEIYGSTTLKDIEKLMEEEINSLPIRLEFFQSCIEGEIVKRIGDVLLNDNADAIIMNAGAYSHTSIAILDALKSLSIPIIEVHLSNIHRREEFRCKSITAQAASGIIAGFGVNSYILALQEIRRFFKI